MKLFVETEVTFDRITVDVLPDAAEGHSEVAVLRLNTATYIPLTLTELKTLQYEVESALRQYEDEAGS